MEDGQTELALVVWSNAKLVYVQMVSGHPSEY